jgi:hypothetical protein
MEPGHRGGGGTSANGRIHAGHWEAAASAQAMRTWKHGPEHRSDRRLRIHARAVLEMV